MTLTQTPQQRDHARTIFEKSQPGRRAFVAPALDVPAREGLLPDRLRRAEPAKLPEIAEPEIVRHYNRLSKRNFDLDTGFYPLGSCTMKHNPKLHERVAALPGNAQAAPAPAPEAGAGRAAADVGAPARARRDRRAAARVAAAERGLARRAGRRAAHPRLPRRPRRPADQGADAGHRARDQPGDGDDGGLRGRQDRHRRARRRRHRGPQGQGGRRRRVPDAHQPEHARPVRREHRGDRRASSTTWARRSTTTARTSTR